MKFYVFFSERNIPDIRRIASRALYEGADRDAENVCAIERSDIFESLIPEPDTGNLSQLGIREFSSEGDFPFQG